MKKLIINESEKAKILSLYGNVNEDLTNDIVITDWLSPDEKYVVFLDELFDIENKVKLGNIWEDYNTLKTFLHHTFSSSNLSKQLKENADKVLNNKLLTESTQSLSELKQGFKTILNEGLISSFNKWVANTGKSTIDGFVEFAKTTYKGGAALIDNISKGEWKEDFNLLKKGVIYLFRKVRSAMYHPVGLILDAILVATGIGKSVQWIPWAIIVALDIYEFMSGNYEEDLPGWKRLLFFGIDVLGLVTTGVAAKAAKTAVGGKTLGELGKTSAGKRLLTNIAEYAGKAPDKLREAVKILSVSYPRAGKFIGGVLGHIAAMIEALVLTIKPIIKLPNKILTKVIPGTSKLAKGSRAGIGSSAIVGGIGTYGEYNQEEQNKEMSGYIRDTKVNYGIDDI
jgi:hypothetical protein